MEESKLVLKGETVEDKLKSVEGYLNSLNRRFSKTVVSVAPNIPILFPLSSPDENGLLFFYISPLKAQITTFAIHIGEFKEKSIVYVEIKNGPKPEIFEYHVTQQSEVVPLNYPILPGNLIKIYVRDPTEVKGVTIGILLEPDLSQAKKEQFVIQALLEKQESEMVKE